MSEELKSVLNALVEEEKHRIEKEILTYANALILSTDPNGLELTITIEGSDISDSHSMRRILDELCKVGLVSTDVHYTHRNAQLIARATPQGMQIAKLLDEENRK